VLLRNHSIRALTFARLVLEVDDLFALPTDDPEAALTNNLVLHVLGAGARSREDFALGALLQFAVEILGPAVSPCLEVLPCIDAEDELDVVLVPAIERFGQSEVGVAAQHHLVEASSSHELDRAIEVRDHALVRRPVAASIGDEEGLGRVGKRDHQRVIAPDPVVRDVHPFLALAIGRDQRAIRLDRGDGFGEARGLASPYIKPGLVDRILQIVDRSDRETPTEITGGRRVWDAPRAQRVEEDTVVAPKLDVIERSTAAERVEANVQDMVGLVVGRVDLQQMQPVVDPLGQADLLEQALDRSDPAVRDRPGLVRQLVAYVASREHGPVLVHADRGLELFLDLGLFTRDAPSYASVHSKSPLGVPTWDFATWNIGGFSSLISHWAVQSRLVS
jgi:hypothetical protein